MPVITVIVPFYQTDKNLFDMCVNSILEDKNADIELLIIDDGSAKEHHSTTDSCLSDPRVKVFHRPHQGVSAARNYGISKASGTWLMFVDSDDYLGSGWYSELKTYFDNDEDLLIFNGCKDSGETQIENHYFVKEGVDYGSSEELRLLVMESAFTVGRLPKGYLSFFSLGSPCSRLFKTSFLKQSGIKFDEKITFAEDTLFALNILFRAHSIVYADKYLYHYVMHESSATHRYRQGLSDEMIQFFDAASLFLVKNNLKDRMESAYLNRAFYEMNRAIRLEFFHKDNTNSFLEKHRVANCFVRKEPFCSALKRGIRGEYGTTERIESILIKMGLYSFMTQIRALALRSSRIKAFFLLGRTVK